jgi:hypothetical protein
MKNDLYNSVIYSKEPMINSWDTFVSILNEYGITEEDYPMEQDKFVYIIEDGKLEGYWGDDRYEEALNNDMFIRNFKNHTHINIDELKNSEEMDNFFFESIVKKVLSDWQWIDIRP